MPMQTGGSGGLYKKLGSKLDNAVKKHGKDETNYGFVSLPPGITNGVAQLDKMYFEQYKSGEGLVGEYYLRGVGIVQEPETIATPQGVMKVAGLQTSIMIPCCETKTQEGKVTSVEENIARVLNEMRKLGASTDGLSGAQLETTAALLTKARPYFKFSTSPKKDRTTGEVTGAWENWHGTRGLPEDYAPPDAAAAATEDGTGAPPPPRKPSAGGVTATPPAPEGEPFNEEVDLDSLVARATDQDGEAQADLREMAINAGHAADVVDSAEDWPAVKEMIENPVKEEEETTVPPPTPTAPKKPGPKAATPAPKPTAKPKPTPPPPPAEPEWQPIAEEIYLYKPIDPKTKKPAAKAIECEVVEVDEANKTVKLKNVDNPKVTYTAKWTALESA